jgi:hypothetical protein
MLHNGDRRIGSASYSPVDGPPRGVAVRSLVGGTREMRLSKQATKIPQARPRRSPIMAVSCPPPTGQTEPARGQGALAAATRLKWLAIEAARCVRRSGRENLTKLGVSDLTWLAAPKPGRFGRLHRWNLVSPGSPRFRSPSLPLAGNTCALQEPYGSPRPALAARPIGIGIAKHLDTVTYNVS